MDLKLAQKLFLVGGASSGLGRATALALLDEGADVVAIARNVDPLRHVQKKFDDQLSLIAGDLTDEDTHDRIFRAFGDRIITGAVVNAGGPPAKAAIDTTLADWDAAYHLVLRWKIALTQRLVAAMLPQNYGRIVFIESVSVKQPLENLVLSNSMRLAVVGFVKTLSQEIASQGITLNILGPGLHDTPRLHSLIKKNAELLEISLEEASARFAARAKVGTVGDPDQFATLALWLLSPHSGYVTGQTISLDGGFVKGTMG